MIRILISAICIAGTSACAAYDFSPYMIGPIAASWFALVTSCTHYRDKIIEETFQRLKPERQY